MSEIINPTIPMSIVPLPNGGLDIQGIEDQENRLQGRENSDRIIGGNLNDILNGSGGDDTISSGLGDDRISGGEGNDQLLGSDGNDTISGGSGENIISGGAGDDRIIIKSGGSTLTGGEGQDVFQFNFTQATSDPEDPPSIDDLGIAITEITDFQPGEDRIAIQGLGGTEAPIYNSDTGIFSLDDVEIAQLATNLSISEDDLEIVGNNNRISTVNNTEATVYRFFNPSAGVHFYTPSEKEKDNVIANLTNYNYEGEAYRSVDPMTGGQEVYRFFNSSTGVHLYTINEVERDNILETLPDFKFEGVQFYAYETQVQGSIPIYRFYEASLGVHFYTPSEKEKDNVIANLTNYNYEGVAYYALPVNNNNDDDTV